MSRIGRSLACGLLLALPAAAFALGADGVYAAVAKSVWRVVSYDADGLPLGQGSGVVVGDDRLVTNCHVLAKAKRVSVLREKLRIDARLDLWDTERDLCQLKTASPLQAPAVRTTTAEQVRVGESVYAIGNPQGLESTLSAGVVSSLRKDSAGRVILIQTSAPISPGSSGGGLFDEQGRLVGITTLGSRGEAQNLNFAVPADWVVELPARHAKLRGAAAAASGAASAASKP